MNLISLQVPSDVQCFKEDKALHLFVWLPSYSMLKIADMNEVYADYAKPGGWNGLYQAFAIIYVF